MNSTRKNLIRVAALVATITGLSAVAADQVERRRPHLGGVGTEIDGIYSRCNLSPNNIPLGKVLGDCPMFTDVEICLATLKEQINQNGEMSPIQYERQQEKAEQCLEIFRNELGL